MTAFKTTNEQRMNMARIMTAMDDAGLPHDFIVGWQDLAGEDQGVYELGELWQEEADEHEREELVVAIQDLLDEAEELPRGPVHKPRLDFDKLGDVAGDVQVLKERLRDHIDRNGGVSAVARKIGMPQPSLSRFLNTPSMPRRTTLYKIAHALDLDESEVVSEWVR